MEGTKGTQRKTETNRKNLGTGYKKNANSRNKHKEFRQMAKGLSSTGQGLWLVAGRCPSPDRNSGSGQNIVHHWAGALVGGQDKRPPIRPLLLEKGPLKRPYNL